jgi:hypothetical protein
MASDAAAGARLGTFRLAGIVAVSFGLNLVSGTLEPALLGSKVIALVPDRAADTAVFGAVTFGGLLVAVVAQPLIGAWSDRANTPLGRRLPFMLAGAGWRGSGADSDRVGDFDGAAGGSACSSSSSA